METKIDIANLNSLREAEHAIRQRNADIGKAEAHVVGMFGESTLNHMLRLRDGMDGRPTLAFLRQIAKPDLQHNALYIATRSLGFQLLTLEWHNDSLTMQKGYYKRTYVRLPLASVGRKGNVYVKDVGLVDNATFGMPLNEIEVKEPGIKAFADTASRMGSRLSSSVTGTCKLPEFHKRLRGAVEGNDQLTYDTSTIAAEAAHRHGGRTDGQAMYKLIYMMQGVMPNMIFAFTDWNGDDPKIQGMYLEAVGFLATLGLGEPLQTIIPSLSGLAEGGLSNSRLQPEEIVPANVSMREIESVKDSGCIDATYVESARAILRRMKSARG